MPKSFLLAIAIVCCISASGQNKKALEISLLSRYDRHANYITNFAGRSYNDAIKLSGASHGINLQFRQSLASAYSVYFGAGYYRLGVNKVRVSMPLQMPGIATARSINNEDDDSTKMLYGTSRYHYNNLAFTAGLSKTFRRNEKFMLDAGAEIVGYYSFSQKYKLSNGYTYKTSHTKLPEFGINLTIGTVKEYGNFYLRPALLIPVYQNLKGDRVFYEKRNMNVPEWFHGVGLTLRAGKYMHKK